nr:4-hydroxythreonine-4-phosphate dehydrogenase 2 [Klebsiella pneumoniae]
MVVVGCAQTLRRIPALNITPRAELRIINHPAEASFSPATINVIDEPLSDPQGCALAKSRPRQDLAFRCIRRATALALEGAVAAIATAPLNKEALHLAGHAYPGHTELLAHLTQTTDYAMVLYTEKLKVIHITTHISLRQFLDTLNQPRIETVIGVADRFLRRVGYPRPRIAVAGVNPHAGENGLFGDEEIRIVAPAVAAMRAKEWR